MALPTLLGQLRGLGVLSWSRAQMDFSILGLLQDIHKSHEGLALAGLAAGGRCRSVPRAGLGLQLGDVTSPLAVLCLPADPDGVGAPRRRDQGDHPWSEPGPGLLGDRAGRAGGRGAVHAPARALRRG